MLRKTLYLQHQIHSKIQTFCPFSLFIIPTSLQQYQRKPKKKKKSHMINCGIRPVVNREKLSDNLKTLVYEMFFKIFNTIRKIQLIFLTYFYIIMKFISKLFLKPKLISLKHMLTFFFKK